MLGHWTAVLIKNASGNADALPDRFAKVLARKIIVVFGNFIMPKDRTGDLGAACLEKHNQRFARRPENRRSIRRI